MDLPQATNQSIIPQDRLSATKTLYDANAAEVFGKNFLAGFARSLGSISIYLIFLFVIYRLITTYVMPEIQPFIVEYRQAIETITKLNSTTNPGTGLDSNQYQQFLKDLNSSLPISQ